MVAIANQDWARSVAAAPVAPAAAAGQPLRARHNLRTIVLGVLCVCLGGLGSAFAWLQLSDTQQVLVMQTSVARGQQLTSTDFALVDMTVSPGVSVLTAADMQSLLGQTALVDLSPGTVLASDLIGVETLPAGQVRLGLKLALGRLPIGEIPIGAQVLLIDVTQESTSSIDSAVVRLEPITGVVLSSPKALADGLSLALDVQVSQAQAESLARLAAHDNLALLVLGGE